jgi:hypothetical protein
MHQMSRLIRVRHTDEDVQRRGVNIILMAAGLHIMALLLTIYAGFAGRLSTQVSDTGRYQSHRPDDSNRSGAQRFCRSGRGNPRRYGRLSVSRAVRSSVTTLSSRRYFS